MIVEALPAVEASLVFRHPGGGELHQGSAPKCGPHLAEAGFRVLVLCANEWQPPARVDPHLLFEHDHFAHIEHPYPGVLKIHAPNDDNPKRFTVDQFATARRAADLVALHVRRGAKVLVTCWMGLNRSGLVSALALHELLGVSGRDAVAHVRRMRGAMALGNPRFVEALDTVHARRVAVAPHRRWMAGRRPASGSQP